MKTIAKLTSLVLILFVTSFVSAQAQESNSKQSKKEMKMASSLEKAKLDLAKSRIKVSDMTAEHAKKKEKFEKLQAKGKLSPNDVASRTKALDKLAKKIEKEEATIERLEKFIEENSI